MAVFISIVCAEPINWLQKRKVPQGIAIALVFILIVALFFILGQIIGRSLSSFSENLPNYEENLNAIGTSLLQFLRGLGIDLSVDKLSGVFDPAKVMSLTGGILGQLSLFMGNALTIVFLALFLLLELDSISEKAKAIYQDSIGTINYLNAIGKSIRHYLTIKTATSLLTGVFVWIGLAILGLDYAIIWALLAFLLNYIPNIGSIIAAIPAILFALIQLGFGGALWTTGIFVVVNMVIGNVVEPKMMGKGMGLSTFVVFLSLIFWGFLLGTTGMFLSVPLTMAIKIILEQHPDTAWIAVLLGTKDDALALREKKQQVY
jgi:predicted PurR-regulated permease PerM